MNSLPVFHARWLMRIINYPKKNHTHVIDPPCTHSGGRRREYPQQRHFYRAPLGASWRRWSVQHQSRAAIHFVCCCMIVVSLISLPVSLYTMTCRRISADVIFGFLFLGKHSDQKKRDQKHSGFFCFPLTSSVPFPNITLCAGRNTTKTPPLTLTAWHPGSQFHRRPQRTLVMY